MEITTNNIDEAFLFWYEEMKKSEKDKKAEYSRDGDVVGEILGAVTIIKDPTRCIMQNDIRKMPIRYAIGELLWYDSANNELKGIRNYTNSWDRMSDDGCTVNSNYGYCIKKKFGFDQLENVKKELTKNKNSRRAVVHIKTADLHDEESKDVNCTVYLQFFVREGKLIMHTHMRSNDLWMGFPYDVFQFTCMQIRLSMELGLDIGEYVHFVDSLHMYKRDYDVAVNREKRGTKNGI